MSQNKIAKQLNVNQSSISREVSRNTGKRGYRFKQKKILSEKRRLVASKAIKMTTPLITLINTKIKEKWSHKQISGWLKEDQNVSISYETIYRHICSDKRCDG
jgi:IS30 family transposase